MKALKNRILALLLSTSVSAGAIAASGTSHAFAMMRPDESGSSDTAEASLNDAPEGEAIVMYSGKTQMQSNILSASIDNDVTVIQSLTFDVKENTEEGRLFAQSQPSLVRQNSSDFTVSLVKSDTLSTSQLISKLRSQPGVLKACPNYTSKIMSYSQDTYSDYQWALENTGQNGGTPGLDVNADTPALSSALKDGEEQVVAVVDSGIDYTHDDLKDRMWNNPFQNTGKLAGLHGYDFANLDDDPIDDNGHGTHCAGIIGASKDNDIGISGIATDDNIRLMALKYLNANGYGTAMGEFSSYNYIYKAQCLGVNVTAINNSWGASFDVYDEDAKEYFEMFQSLIDLTGSMGAVTVAAAGNSAEDNDVVYGFPSTIDSKYLVSVAASDENDELTTFSSYGANSVDIAAPGLNILSTVSYNNLHPTFLTDEQKEQAFYMYMPFDGAETEAVYEPDVIPLPSDNGKIAYSVSSSGKGAELSVEITSEKFFGKAADNSESLKLSVKNGVAGEKYKFYLPYYGQDGDNKGVFLYSYTGTYSISDSDANKQYIYIYDSDVNDDGTYNEENKQRIDIGSFGYCNKCWIPRIVNLPVSQKNKHKAICIEIPCEYDGDYSFYIDEFAVCRNDIDIEQYESKYDYYDGTSMAAPMVTGSVAAIAAANPEMSVDDRISMLYGCTRPSASLEGKVRTGGVLDLSGLENPNSAVNDCWADPGTGILHVRGSKLTDMEFTIDGKQPEMLEQSEYEITFDISEYANHEFALDIQNGETTKTKYLYFSSGNPAEISLADSSLMVYGGNMLNIDDSIYYCDRYGSVYSASPDKENANWCPVNPDSPLDPTIMDTTTSIQIITPDITLSSFVTDGNDIYTVAFSDFGYMQKNCLIRFNMQNTQWEKVCDLPDECNLLYEPAIGFYKGDLMVMGGYLAQSGTDSEEEYPVQSFCYSYSFKNDEWTEMQSLPEASYGGTAIELDGKLYVTLQKDNTDATLQRIWSFDGKTWNKNAAELPALAVNTMNPYNASVSVYDDKLVYIGVPAEGVGDIFTVDLADGAVESLNYYASYRQSDNFCTGTVCGNTLYVFQQISYDTLLDLFPLGGFPLFAEVEKGDITQDGQISMDDATMLLSYVAAVGAGITDATLTDGTNEAPEEMVRQAADVNGDGEITIADASLILTYYARLSAGMEVEWADLIS